MNGILIMIDQFHGEKKVNHKTCPSSTYFEYYKKLLELWELYSYFKKINTTSTEQVNAKLRMMGQSCRQAKMSNYILYMQSWTEMNNLICKGFLNDRK